MFSKSVGSAFLMSVALACHGQTAPDADKLASVAGTVNNALSGAPMARAHVILSGSTSSGQNRHGAMTTVEGKFSLTGVEAGHYVLTVEKTGFVAPSPASAPVQIDLKEKDKKDGMNLKLLPTGAIVGRVTDADGQPVEGAVVGTDGIAGEIGMTDEKGHFRIGGLAPGKYRVRAAPSPAMMGVSFAPEIRTDGSEEPHYAATWSPGVLSGKEAGRVEVRPDGEAGGADIQLRRVPWVRVSGRFVGLAQGQKAMVSARPDRPPLRGGQQGQPAKPDGSFEFWRLDPGKYRLSANWTGSGGQNAKTADVEIEVAGSSIENLELRAVADSDIPGTVEFDDEVARQALQPATAQPSPGQTNVQQAGQGGGKAVPRQRLSIVLRETGSGATPGGVIQMDDAGNFQLKKVPAGQYRVTVRVRGNALYVKSMRLGATNFEGAVLDLRNGSGGAELSVRVSSAVGSVAGTIAGDNVGGTRVVLKPEGPDDTFSRRYSGAGPDGKYRIDNLAPGNYKLFAVPETEMDPLARQGGLDDYEDLMESVTIHPGDNVVKDLKPRIPGER